MFGPRGNKPDPATVTPQTPIEGITGEEPLPGGEQAPPTPEQGAGAPQPPVMTPEKAIREAKRLALMVDLGLTRGLGMGFGLGYSADDVQFLKMTEDERTEFIEVWAEYIQEEGSLGIPPIINVLIVSGLLVFGKVMLAMKEKKKNAAMDADIEAREAETPVLTVWTPGAQVVDEKKQPLGHAYPDGSCAWCGKELAPGRKFCNHQHKGFYQAEMARRAKAQAGA